MLSLPELDAKCRTRSGRPGRQVASRCCCCCCLCSCLSICMYESRAPSVCELSFHRQKMPHSNQRTNFAAAINVLYFKLRFIEPNRTQTAEQRSHEAPGRQLFARAHRSRAIILPSPYLSILRPSLIYNSRSLLTFCLRIHYSLQ